MLTQDQIEREIRRLESAACHEDPPVGWRKVKSIRRVLRWVLGIEPQSPLDYIMDPAPRELPDVDVTRRDASR